ncbi:MAG: tRNA (N(6)-L-threonylcarbamoyladenosine(37)-C(2))-methylthiotransferase MtaB [Clostridiales Family XIII bacterium]|jgi:threonylcarbamoyladenosine tRNA methylthiotransferase MtaB|nr:tRNA (N(6)-L-threonylcarbamoyladenosine(37)-C(2))-methylthiotransferase MtaB [Clostridiales Family XIII bacterium]
MNRRIAFYTLGCKVNQYETAKLAERFAELGFSVVPETERADVYVINSCTVTGIADRKSRNFARRAKKLNHGAVVAMIGCYAETSADELAHMPEIDVLLGSAGKDGLPALICERLGDSEENQETDGSVSVSYNGADTAAEGRTRSYLKIEDGCDRHCAYCVIPAARGPVRSRAYAAIMAEAAELIRRGCQEIILTGINAALYGDGGYDLIALTKEIANLPGEFRIRLSSLEPTVVNAGYARRLIGIDKLCPHLHLSLQSGSDDVLAAMGRRYSIEDYRKIIAVLRERDPLFGVTTDIIVGFPGETEADFERSVDAVRRIGFAHVHVFRYSKRPGTRAADMPGQIPEQVKKERSDRLMAAAAEAAREYREKCRGATRRALVLAAAKNGALRAVTDNGIEVEIPGGGSLINTMVDITL